MNYIRKNPRKSAFLAMYIAIFILNVTYLGFSFGKLLTLYIAATLIFMLTQYSTFTAMLGNFFFATGKREKGLWFIKFAIDHNTPSPAAHLNYAVCLTRDGKGAEALECLAKAEARRPDLLTLKNIELTRASAYWTMGETATARKLLEDMRRKFEYVNYNVLTTLGYMYICLDELDKAEEVSRRAIDDNPNVGSPWDNLGQIFLKQDKKEDAKEAFLKAVELNPNLPDSLYHLAELMKDEGDTDAARGYLERAKHCDITALNTVTKEQVKEALAGL